MTIRAVLCDIYKTLLEVGPPPAEAGQRWDQLCHGTLPGQAPPTLAGFVANTELIIRREHAAAKAGGVPYPEIFWPAVACEAWPALAALDAGLLDRFLFEHAQLQRTVRLMPGVTEALRSLADGKRCLGLVSNSQPYTLHELDAAFRGAGLSRAIFAPDLCFFSFDHGFSKPDPHVFRLLTARLARRGIVPGETMVVGDREDNDISPARAAGFQTWRLTGESLGDGGGDWRAFGEKIRAG